MPRSVAVDITPDQFRTVLGRYPTGVCIVTGCNADGDPAGLVVGSFTSVSLDPPLVAFFPDKRSTSWPRVRASGYFCVNVLAEDQFGLGKTFAVSGGDKFVDVAYRLSPRSLPILDDVVAFIECTLDNEFDAGDHMIVLGRVIDMQIEREANPLLFFRGKFGRLAELS